MRQNRKGQSLMPKYLFQCGRRAGRLGIPKNHLQKRKHVGFYLDIFGVPVHVFADPDTDDATLEALRQMARAAIRAMNDGTIGKGGKD